MSTHNIGFREEMTKIIVQLSSNIIKYALYLFFCFIVPRNNYTLMSGQVNIVQGTS